MLVLTRKVNESLRIGNHIRIRVLDQNGKQVRLGIEAPKEMRVIREELFEWVANANRSAADHKPEDQSE